MKEDQYLYMREEKKEPVAASALGNISILAEY